MGLVTLPQAEGAGEVASQHIHLLDVGDEGLVDGLLVSGAAAVDLLLLIPNESVTLIKTILVIPGCCRVIPGASLPA